MDNSIWQERNLLWRPYARRIAGLARMGWSGWNVLILVEPGRFIRLVDAR